MACAVVRLTQRAELWKTWRRSLEKSLARSSLWLGKWPAVWMQEAGSPVELCLGMRGYPKGKDTPQKGV